MTGTFYEVLDVPSDASEDEIREAFKRSVFRTHPDSPHVDDDQDDLPFIRVKQAKETLTDPAERERYDRLGHEEYVRKKGLGDIWPVHDRAAIGTPNPSSKPGNRRRNSQRQRRRRRNSGSRDPSPNSWDDLDMDPPFNSEFAGQVIEDLAKAMSQRSFAVFISIIYVSVITAVWFAGLGFVGVVFELFTSMFGGLEVIDLLEVIAIVIFNLIAMLVLSVFIDFGDAEPLNLLLVLGYAVHFLPFEYISPFGIELFSLYSAVGVVLLLFLEFVIEHT